MAGRKLIVFYSLFNSLKSILSTKSIKYNVYEEKESEQMNFVHLNLKTSFLNKLTVLSEKGIKYNAEDAINIIDEVFNVIYTKSPEGFDILLEIYNILDEMFLCEERILNYIGLTFFILKTIIVDMILYSDNNLSSRIPKLQQVGMALYIYKDLLPFIYDIYIKIISLKGEFHTQILFIGAYMNVFDDNKKYFCCSTIAVNKHNRIYETAEEICQNLIDLVENADILIKKSGDSIKSSIKLKMIEISETKKASKRIRELFKNPRLTKKYVSTMEDKLCFKFLTFFKKQMLRFFNENFQLIVKNYEDHNKILHAKINKQKNELLKCKKVA